MKFSFWLLAGAAAMLNVPSVAQADEFDGPDCTGTYVEFEYLQGACSLGRINQHTMVFTNAALARALANSFDIEARAQEAGDAETARLDAIVGEGVHAKPVADVPAAAAASRWNSWIDGKYTYDDANAVAYNQDGDVWNGIAGIDYKVTNAFTVGLMGSGENIDLAGPVSTLKTSGVGIGPYIGYTLNDHIILSASLLGSTIDTKQTDTFNTYHYSSDRVQVSAGGTGYWYLGGWRVSPGFTISYSKEWLKEKNNLLPDHYVEVAMMTPSFQMGRTLKLSETVSVEPWTGVGFDWTFLNRVKYDGSPAIEEGTTDLRVQAGLNFNIGSSAQLSLTGEMGGLINNQVRTYSGEANLAIQF